MWKKDAAKFDALTSDVVEVVAERDNLMYKGESYVVGSEVVITSDKNSREMHCAIVSIDSREVKVRESGEKMVSKIQVRNLRNTRCRLRPDRSRKQRR